MVLMQKKAYAGFCISAFDNCYHGRVSAIDGLAAAAWLMLDPELLEVTDDAHQALGEAGYSCARRLSGTMSCISGARSIASLKSQSQEELSQAVEAREFVHHDALSEKETAHIAA